MPSKAQDVLESLTDYRKGDACPRCREEVALRSEHVRLDYATSAHCTNCDWSTALPNVLRTVYDETLTGVMLRYFNAARARSDAPPQP